MGNLKNWILGLIALIFLSGIASAGLYVGYSNSDFYLEVYSGNTYAYATTPYTYTYSNYYYFDHPYRVYSYGNYYYFEPGWYSYNDYWRFEPDRTSNYTYHSNNYYYYNSSWYYQPNWVYTYGPTYYGSYYYPPYEPTLVGQHYQPEQSAYCYETQVSALKTVLEVDSARKAIAFLYNYSDKGLDVENVKIYSPDADAYNVRFDKYVASGEIGVIEYDLKADEFSGEKAHVNIEVYGTYRDGTYCSGEDISANFLYSVKGTGNANTYNNSNYAQNTNTYNSNNYSNTYNSGNTQTYNNQGSTSYMKAKETSQSWNEVEFSGTENTTATQQEQNNETHENLDRVETVQTYYNKAQPKETTCGGLSVSSKNIVLDADSQKTTYFKIKNYGSEDFSIGSIEAIEYSNGVSVEATRDSQTIYAGQNGAVKVKVFADESQSDRTGTVYLKIKGHYNSGLDCEITSDNFYISVFGEKEGQIKLANPEKIEFEGGAGFVEFALENPSSEKVKVSVYTSEGELNKDTFYFEPKSSGKRVISLNGVENEAKVVFTIESGGKEFLEQYTKVTNYRNFEEPENGNEVITATPEEPKNEDQGLLGTGFSVLAENPVATIMGLIIIAVIFIALAFRE